MRIAAAPKVESANKDERHIRNRDTYDSARAVDLVSCRGDAGHAAEMSKVALKGDGGNVEHCRECTSENEEWL